MKMISFSIQMFNNKPIIKTKETKAQSKIYQTSKVSKAAAPQTKELRDNKMSRCSMRTSIARVKSVA